MSGDRAAAWVYRGIWGVLVRFFRVPPEPPALQGAGVESFRPGQAWLRYLKFWFWIVLTITDLVFIGAWTAIWVASPLAGALVTPIALFVIMSIHEVTITYENIQNVSVRNGPIQRLFGIADVTVETAGGGGGGGHGKHGGGDSHQGLIEGVADAERIRDLIMARLKRSKTAGLGDDQPAPVGAGGLSAEHIAVLRQIRDLSGAIAGRG